MKINVCSETEMLHIRSEGVHISFIDCVELLKEKKDVEVCVNSEGIGDVMHSHTYGPYYFWRGLKYKGKRVHTVHVIPDSTKGSLPGWKFLMPLTKWYFKKVFSYADVCIAISPMVERAIKDLGAKTKIVRLSNPINIDKWKRTPRLRKKGRELLKLKEDDFCVLGVGQMENRKGCKDFIKIGQQIPDAQFRWVGGRPLGIFTEGIRKLNKSISGASSHIKFVGEFDHANMPSIYAAADLFLFPSYQENCPLAPIEAAASGMPVVYRNLPEYEMLYKNNYLKAENNEMFITLAKKLMDDKEEYKRGLEISAKLITQFERNEIRKDLISLYSSMSAK